MRYLLLLALTVSLPSLAIEPLPSRVLLDNCSGTDATRLESCRSWLHGFVGGAFATRTAREVEPGAGESYRERAARTRISRGRYVYGRNAHVGYCIPKGATLEELAGNLNAYGKTVKNMPEHANLLVLGMLRVHYPCPAPRAKPEPSD